MLLLKVLNCKWRSIVKLRKKSTIIEKLKKPAIIEMFEKPRYHYADNCPFVPYHESLFIW